MLKGEYCKFGNFREDYIRETTQFRENKTLAN